MPAIDTLRATFPDALPLAGYLDAVAGAIAPLEFTPERTFAAVSVCRDELTQELPAAVAGRWGAVFSLGGLGALPSLGRTGWRAALSHVPDRGGRGHLLVFGTPHLGIDSAGVVGRSLRRHQDEPTPTCGAMVALREQLVADGEAAPSPLPPGLDDNEAQRLRRLVVAEGVDPAGSLVDLTRAAARAVEVEMWSELEALEAWRDMDVAVFCGIQVHVNDHGDHVVPTAAAVQGADGTRRPLKL